MIMKKVLLVACLFSGSVMAEISGGNSSGAETNRSQSVEKSKELSIQKGKEEVVSVTPNPILYNAYSYALQGVFAHYGIDWAQANKYIYLSCGIALDQFKSEKKEENGVLSKRYYVNAGEYVEKGYYTGYVVKESMAIFEPICAFSKAYALSIPFRAWQSSDPEEHLEYMKNLLASAIATSKINATLLPLKSGVTSEDAAFAVLPKLLLTYNDWLDIYKTEYKRARHYTKNFSGSAKYMEFSTSDGYGLSTGDNGVEISYRGTKWFGGSSIEGAEHVVRVVRSSSATQGERSSVSSDRSVGSGSNSSSEAGQ